MENNNIKERLKDLKMKPGTPYANIPKQLIVADKPEYARFPFNVLFVSYRMREGKLQQGHAIYEPDLSLYRENDRGCGLTYWNRYGWIFGDAAPRNDWRIFIFWDHEMKTWFGGKCKGKDVVQDAAASGWEEFFIRFTALGLADGEQCAFKAVGDAPKSISEEKPERVLGFRV